MGKHHLTIAQGNGRNRGPAVCLGCQRPIVYGDRCQRCQHELRQRKRRKPR
jgi:hypothetical protein